MAEMKKLKKKLSIFIIQKVLHPISAVKISQTLIAKTLKNSTIHKSWKLFCYQRKLMRDTIVSFTNMFGTPCF